MFYHEYCCSDWLTFKNINQFIEGAKQILLDIGFIKGRVVYMSRQVKLNLFYFSVYFNPPRTSYFLLFSDFIYHMVPRVKLLYIILRTFFDSSKCTIPSTRFKQRSGRGQWITITQYLAGQETEELIWVGTSLDDIPQTRWKSFLHFIYFSLGQKIGKTSRLNPLGLKGCQLSQASLYETIIYFTTLQLLFGKSFPWMRFYFGYTLRSLLWKPIPKTQ